MEPYLGQITMFAGNFAPKGWALCNGQLLPIQPYQRLFSLLGTMYGGDGRTAFALPDLRGRVPIHKGTGSDEYHSSNPVFIQGAKGGEESHTLTMEEMPQHTHDASVHVSGTFAFNCSSSAGTQGNPRKAFLGATTSGKDLYSTPAESTVLMAPNEATDFGVRLDMDKKGGNLAHNNMMSYQVVNFIIALTGTYPNRNLSPRK